MILLFRQNGSTIISWFLTKYSFMLLGVDDELQTNLMCGNETFKGVVHLSGQNFGICNFRIN